MTAEELDKIIDESEGMQVVRCKCGNAFAACVDGLQDDEWYTNLGKYISNGCTVKIEESFTLGKCECVKTKP